MLNEIIKGISMALNTAFGDGYEIYQNDVEQDLKEGCFFIQVLKPELSPLLGRRSMKRNPIPRPRPKTGSSCGSCTALKSTMTQKNPKSQHRKENET